MRPVPDEDCAEAVELVSTHGSIKAAARATGRSFGDLQRRVKAAAERGLDVRPGFRVSRVTTDGDGKVTSFQQQPDRGPEFEMPATHRLGKITVQRDGDGRVIQDWVRAHPAADGIDWAATFAAAFADYKGAEPTERPLFVEADFCTVIPCNDWHINLLTWAREVGESWDLKIAERKIGDAIEVAIARSRRCGLAVVLGGGDLMHNDDNTNRTAKSGNLLDADGRHQKGIEAAQRLKVRTIDAALAHNGEVVVRVLKGNHDEQSSVAIAHFLRAWYRHEPRVTVDLDASLFWYHQFGRVMLAATHGHTVKLAQMPAIMAHRRAEMWGATKFRYCHGFHIHHKSKLATEGEGVICESHQAPIPQDGWHYGSGYLSGRSVQTITYHAQYGEVSRAREAIIDAA